MQTNKNGLTEESSTRRTFLKVTSVVAGGLVVGTRTVVAESPSRYLVETTRSHIESSNVKPIHILDGPGIAVVKGLRKDVEKLGAYAKDIKVAHAPPPRTNRIHRAPLQIRSLHRILQMNHCTHSSGINKLKISQTH